LFGPSIVECPNYRIPYPEIRKPPRLCDHEPLSLERPALRILQLGAVAVVLAACALVPFDLDRFFVPKELVLHAAALLAGLAAAGALARAGRSRADRLLAAYLALGALSAALATNRWLGFRALAVSASGVLLYWIGRWVGRPLAGALAFAVVLAAATSLLQTYGLQTVLFASTRAPGGTLGNRNFVAHAAAFGLPLLLYMTLRARRRGAFLAAALGTTVVIASLVLTRSRAAWLAFAAVALVTLAAMLASVPLRRDPRLWRRLGAVALLSAAGVAAALFIPNALRWRGNNPYLASMRRVADYEQGSGRGRLVQYGQSLRMSLHHPLLGVGPGNWAVVYPRFASRRDPSMNESEPGTTSNPWPSSDWIAAVAERGVAAAALLALAFLAIAAQGMRRLVAARDADDALAAAALLGTVTGAVVTGLFDAVLLLALPTFLVWAALGALSPPEEAAPGEAPSPRRGWIVVLLLLAVAAAGAIRSGAQLVAMEIYTTHGDRASLARAARIDPGNYRLRLRLARVGGRGRCEHARAAHALYPCAQAAADAARGCGPPSSQSLKVAADDGGWKPGAPLSRDGPAAGLKPGPHPFTQDSRAAIRSATVRGSPHSPSK
jgi:hypothetical protein